MLDEALAAAPDAALHGDQGLAYARSRLADGQPPSSTRGDTTPQTREREAPPRPVRARRDRGQVSQESRSSVPGIAVKYVGIRMRVALPAWSDRPLAVDGVSLAIDRNEILCVVGESGSGKSVMAKSILGLLPAPHVRVVNGAIHFENRNLLQVGEEEMLAIRGGRISMIFQEPMVALNPLMKVGAQIGRDLPRAHGHQRAGSAPARHRAVLRRTPPRSGSHPGQLSPRAVGRAAPAGDDRHGARAGARSHHRRRAHHRAGRDHPGPRSSPCSRSCRASTAPR